MAIQTEVDVVTSALREEGFSFMIDYGRKHVKVTWFANGRSHVYHCAKTPSDWRALINCRSRIRRMLRQVHVLAAEPNA